jgi:leucyl-tRNA synthetase
MGPAATTLRRSTHRAIAAVTEALETFAFNVAVARLYELASSIGEAERVAAAAASAVAASEDDGFAWARHEAILTMARLLAPMTPHLAEEIHTMLNPERQGLLCDEVWPEADRALVAAQTVTIAVQVMGKLRATLALAPGADAAMAIAAAEAEPNVARLLAGRRVVKRIHVPDRIVNFVVAG